MSPASIDWWVASGTLTLGFTIGWLVWTFVARATTFSLKALSTVSAIAAGGALLVLWQRAEGSGIQKEANAYFVGVFLAVAFLAALKYEPPPNA
jgi:hypothetical protein